MKRTFAWVLRNRRLARDYKRNVQTSETLIEVAMIRLLVARLGRPANDTPNTLVARHRAVDGQSDLSRKR